MRRRELTALLGGEQGRRQHQQKRGLKVALDADVRLLSGEFGGIDCRFLDHCCSSPGAGQHCNADSPLQPKNQS
jgi:hypothetical protein